MSVLIDKLATRLARALGGALEDVRADVQQRISVPVERVGNKVVRSKPGEPPRKDTGRLYTSAAVNVIDATRTVVGSVSVDTPYARTLVRQKNRPIFGPVLRNHRSTILDALRRAPADRS